MARSGVGSYSGTLTGAFTTDKTGVFVMQTHNTLKTVSTPNNINSVSVASYTSGGSSTDGAIQNAFIEIRVYP